MFVHRRKKGGGWWQRAAEDGQEHEKAFEAFALPACVQEPGKDQVPDSDGKTRPAQPASWRDAKCPDQGVNTAEGRRVKKTWSTTAREKEAEEGKEAEEEGGAAGAAAATATAAAAATVTVICYKKCVFKKKKSIFDTVKMLNR